MESNTTPSSPVDEDLWRGANVETLEDEVIAIAYETWRITDGPAYSAVIEAAEPAASASRRTGRSTTYSVSRMRPPAPNVRTAWMRGWPLPSLYRGHQERRPERQCTSGRIIRESPRYQHRSSGRGWPGLLCVRDYCEPPRVTPELLLRDYDVISIVPRKGGWLGDESVPALIKALTFG